ncbi:UNVERIFIED_CONTAM: hypothetical protein FKN15_070250 [Acipenser sinensis]
MVCPVAKAPCGLGNCVLRSAVEISASLEQKAVPWPQAVLTWHFQEPRHEDGIGQATLQPAEISDHGVNSPRPLKTVSGETTHLRALTQDLEEVRSQQVAEMKEVENYVDHIRNLSEEREALTAEYERENEQLRGELQQLRLEQEAHLKEVEEMLDQEGLAEISHSSPSEQIAYLLVERATLLEKLESAERKLDSQSYTGSLREYQHSQKTNQNLSDQLLSCQHESERLQEELRRVLHQLDSHVRRYSEKQARHKAKLRQAKEFFLRETVERDGRIRKLEKDLMLARSLAEKEQEWIRKVTDVNEKLLVEKRELLRRLSEEEELGQTCTRTISTRQHRLNCLEEENRQLQDRTLRLSNQVGALERALRSVQSVCSMEPGQAPRTQKRARAWEATRCEPPGGTAAPCTRDQEGHRAGKRDQEGHNRQVGGTAGRQEGPGGPGGTQGWQEGNRAGKRDQEGHSGQAGGAPGRQAYLSQAFSTPG